MEIEFDIVVSVALGYFVAQMCIEILRLIKNKIISRKKTNHPTPNLNDVVKLRSVK